MVVSLLGYRFAQYFVSFCYFFLGGFDVITEFGGVAFFYFITANSCGWRTPRRRSAVCQVTGTSEARMVLFIEVFPLDVAVIN